jgi:hypothetical protein
MGLDVAPRYTQIRNAGDVDHVCTGKTAYRDTLATVGLLDETLGYGYDNDLSYRLRHVGYRLAICPEATSSHGWRDGFVSYLRQQYGFGSGRLDLVAKHRHKLAGDDVSRLQLDAACTADGGGNARCRDLRAADRSAASSRGELALVSNLAQWIAVGASIALLVLVLELVRRRRSLIWILSSDGADCSIARARNALDALALRPRDMLWARAAARAVFRMMHIRSGVNPSHSQGRARGISLSWSTNSLHVIDYHC